MMAAQLDQANMICVQTGGANFRALGLRTCGTGAVLPGLVLAALLLAPAAHAQAPLPVDLLSQTLGAINVDIIQTIDLDTLPNRPTIIVDVTPQLSHPDIEFEIEIRDVTPVPNLSPVGFDCPIADNAPLGVDSWVSEPATGAQYLEADVFFCQPDVGFWDGHEADVRVRVLDFGSGGAPATFTVGIRAVTTVPTQILPVQVMGARSITTPSFRDTVIYAGTLNTNGAGSYLWAGTYTFVAPNGTFQFRRNSLLTFSSLSILLPPNAEITHVELNLEAVGLVGFGGAVDLFAVAPGQIWYPGSADASGNEFFGASTPVSSPNWTHRTSSVNWITPGGDVTTPNSLSTLTIGPLFGFPLGPQVFTSPALNTAVQTMVDNNSFSDGFMLTGPAGLVSSVGVQFASANNVVEEDRPWIQVDFTQPEPYSEGRLDGDLVDYVNEGENFRWIYDDDLDGVFNTLIGGVCEENYTFGVYTVPYTYAYTGTPGYVGHDCCSWRIESAEAQIVGTGQALFFHNLDVNDPSNMPPDFDADGMLDPCDNCPNTPNGPFLGTCMNGTTVAGGTCQSDLECGAGEMCDLSQLDDDGDTVGNACPEPGFGVGLMLGSMLLVSRQHSHRRSAWPNV